MFSIQTTEHRVHKYLTQKDQAVPRTEPLESTELFPELIPQEGKEGVELLAVVAGFHHRGAWRWCRRGVWLAGDLLEDLSFVQEDGVGGGHVEEEAGFVLLDAGDGELHSSGAG